MITTTAWSQETSTEDEMPCFENRRTGFWTLRFFVSQQVQTEMRKNCKKEAPSFKLSEKGPETDAWRARGRASREADRTREALPSTSARQQEADPDHERKEPSRTPDATRSGLQREWAVPDMVTGKTQGHACKNSGRNAREQ